MLIGVLLFAQLAVAAYACPSLFGTASLAAASPEAIVADRMAQAGGTAAADDISAHCGQIDRDAANLCAEHCHAGQQRADTTPAPTVPVAVDLLLYWLPFEATHMPPPGRSFAPPGARLAAAPPPAHAILHCVLRI
ncbi:MAG: hypothetical protein ABIQ06_07750 [Caldimonas sp.]